MSNNDTNNDKKIPSTVRDIITAVAGVVAACSLTYAITTGSYSTRLATAEGKISVLETTVASLKGEFGAKLDNLIKSVDKLDESMNKHITGIK